MEFGGVAYISFGSGNPLERNEGHLEGALVEPVVPDSFTVQTHACLLGGGGAGRLLCFSVGFR